MDSITAALGTIRAQHSLELAHPDQPEAGWVEVSEAEARAEAKARTRLAQRRREYTRTHTPRLSEGVYLHA